MTTHGQNIIIIVKLYLKVQGKLYIKRINFSSMRFMKRWNPYFQFKVSKAWIESRLLWTEHMAFMTISYGNTLILNGVCLFVCAILIEGLSKKVVDFCYNTRLCIRNSLKFVWYFYIHFINILYKYGWNHSLTNTVMNVRLTVCQRVRSTCHKLFCYIFREGWSNVLFILLLYKL